MYFCYIYTKLFHFFGAALKGTFKISIKNFSLLAYSDIIYFLHIDLASCNLAKLTYFFLQILKNFLPRKPCHQ